MSMALRDIRIEDEPENENNKSMSNPTLLRIQGSQDCPLTNRSLHMVSMKDTSVLLPSIQSMGSDGHVKSRSEILNDHVTLEARIGCRNCRLARGMRP